MSKQKEVSAEQVSSGIEALIQQLRDDGVNAGQVEADRLVADAQIKSKQLLADAEVRAKVILEQARAQANTIENAGKDALSIAMRDILLKLKSRLSELVGERVQRLVSAQLAQEDFLKQLILELAAKIKVETAIDKSNDVEFKLPKNIIGLDELRHHPLELQDGSLSHFILNIACDVLREGVSFTSADESFSGLKVILKDKDIVIDVTGERLSDILLQHLQPRFRAILEGMVR